MHAKHADSERLNELSGHVIGSAFIVLKMLGAGFLDKSMRILWHCTNYFKPIGPQLCLLLDFGKSRL
jgi:hypothetical protein